MHGSNIWILVPSLPSRGHQPLRASPFQLSFFLTDGSPLILQRSSSVWQLFKRAALPGPLHMKAVCISHSICFFWCTWEHVCPSHSLHNLKNVHTAVSYLAREECNMYSSLVACASQKHRGECCCGILSPTHTCTCTYTAYQLHTQLHTYTGCAHCLLVNEVHMLLFLIKNFCDFGFKSTLKLEGFKLQHWSPMSNLKKFLELRCYCHDRLK